MSRKEVYKIIDKERQYQNIRWGKDFDKDNNLVDWLSYIQQYLNLALAVPNYDDEEVLENIRKITALGIACLEMNGCPERVIE